MRRSGGSLLGWLWSLVWWPYAYLIIPRHRHPLSHLPVLGTLIRLGYLLVVLFLAWGLLRIVLTFPAFPASLPGSFWWWGLASLVLVDTLHTGMDLFWP